MYGVICFFTYVSWSTGWPNSEGGNEIDWASGNSLQPGAGGGVKEGVGFKVTHT